MKFIAIFFFITTLSACGKKTNNTNPVVPKTVLLNITDVQQERDNSATINFHFTISVDNLSAKEITVKYTTVDGSATAKDYTPTSGIVTIPANQNSVSIDIPVRGDSLRRDKNILHTIK
ncbi:MAG: hypothetical protein M3Z26_14385 [Bacteroidota bacterium]|nr:hypothetical protein [Bacteroidota bacterium]